MRFLFLIAIFGFVIGNFAQSAKKTVSSAPEKVQEKEIPEATIVECDFSKVQKGQPPQFLLRQAVPMSEPLFFENPKVGTIRAGFELEKDQLRFFIESKKNNKLQSRASVPVLKDEALPFIHLNLEIIETSTLVSCRVK